MEHPTLSSDWQDEVRQQIDSWLKHFFEHKHASGQAYALKNKVLIDAIEDLTLRGGKRLRPLLLYATALAVDSKIKIEPLIKAGAALELLQSYFLIHDDWMDQDELRRGDKSVHTMFEARGHDPHQASSLAILAGDLCSSYAWDAMLQACKDHAEPAAVLAAFSDMQQQVILGQYLDVVAHDDIDLIYQLKTGSYTSSGPVLLGALLAGAKKETQDQLLKFAQPLGMAFQLRDDLLGCFGHSETTGKGIGTDLIRQKRTAVLQLAEAKLSADGKALFERLHQDAALSDELLQALLVYLKETGVAEIVENKIEALQSDSLGHLNQAGLRQDGKNTLKELALQFIARAH
ncbi:MAG: polyprenyl synthetase family protein [Myxococcales bacterium]|nr:MAG: polyprenyl synthetase family protein [Myxococcales bacterium]